MAIPITGAGSLFVRLGHIFAVLLDVNAARGSAVTAPDYTVLIPTKVTSNIIPDYAAGTADYPLVHGTTTPRGVQGVALLAATASWQQAQRTYLQGLQTLCQATLIDMAQTDTPGPSLALQAQMQTLVSQLVGNFNVAASTVAIGAQTNGTPAPNGVYAATGNSGPIIIGTKLDGKGFQLDNILAERIVFTCTRDAQSGGATLWSEPISVTGAADASGGDMLSNLWPSGSGKTINLTCVNAALNNSGGNLLVNGEFATFTTANNPDNWTILTGTAGTQFLKSTSGYQDSLSLEMVGDGSTLSSIIQNFATTPTPTVGAGGTSANLLASPDTPFAFNCWIKCSAVPAAGQFQVDLVDSTATIIADDNSNANTINVDLTSGGINTTAWANVNGVFRLPALDTANKPIALRLWQPTGHAISSGKNLLIDRVALAPMTQLYTSGSPAGTAGGPYFAIFAGNLQTLVNDYWTISTTNTWGAWIQHFQRVFGMTVLGLRLPTTGGSTITTGLIV